MYLPVLESQDLEFHYLLQVRFPHFDLLLIVPPPHATISEVILAPTLLLYPLNLVVEHMRAGAKALMDFCDDASVEAAGNGMTPEILNELLQS